MDRLQTMQVFVRVAQHAGFAAAGRELRMSTGAVSKHISALEARIGARLFDRTTRRVGLTEAGRVYLDRCLECLEAFEAADTSVSQLAREPKGSVRVTAPIDFGDCLSPVLAAVMTTHPNLVIDLKLSNRVVDLIEDGVDVAVRIAPALDGQFVVRPVARVHLACYASAAYLQKYGRPRKPEDLASHRNIVFVEPRPYDELTFTRGARKARVKLKTVMTSNLGSAQVSAVAAGLGIAMLPSFLAGAAFEAGRIEPLFPDWSLPEFRVFAVYPHRRFLSPSVRVLVEALRAAFGDGTRDPWWPEAAAQRGRSSRNVGRPSDR